jgi:hypothetical protein
MLICCIIFACGDQRLMPAETRVCIRRNERA